MVSLHLTRGRAKDWLIKVHDHHVPVRRRNKDVKMKPWVTREVAGQVVKNKEADVWFRKMKSYQAIEGYK